MIMQVTKVIADKTIAVVVKAYNEEQQISMVIDNIPDYVDRIIVVNDGSTDGTADVVKGYIDRGCSSSITISDCSNATIDESLYNKADLVLLAMRREENDYYPKHDIYNDNEKDRIVLINQVNSGPGAAVAIGYKWARDHRIACTVVIDGDGQMDPDEMIDLVTPIVCDGIWYTKGNRLVHPASSVIMPQIRYFGNNILSLLTKIASGYWDVSDTQTGYTAISLNALDVIKLYDIYRRYGYPNDILTKLNIVNATVVEVPIKPVYNVGEQSKMKIIKVIPTISKLLLKDFLMRIRDKYLINSFHPLFLFYLASAIMLIINLPVTISLFWRVVIKNGSASIGLYFTFLLLVLFAFQSLSFGMWMDMRDNEKLDKTIK